MTGFRYFAYGSNLLAERLRVRCPSATVVGRVSARGWRVGFESKSFDGSGKASLIAADEAAVVYGVLYDIDESDRAALDSAEGADRDPPIYLRHDDFTVWDGDDQAITGVSVYRAREASEALAPWDWYRALIVAGAMQAGLPAGDVAALAVAHAEPDPETERPSRLEALAVLEAAGFSELAKACQAEFAIPHPVWVRMKPIAAHSAAR